MDRKLIATILIAAGVTYNWGPGWGLVLAGCLFLVLRPLIPSDADAAEFAWDLGGRVDRARAAIVGMPRHAAAIALAATATILVPTGAGLWAGAWLAVLAAGILAAGWAVMLGWET
jgi:hypothetical protein